MAKSIRVLNKKPSFLRKLEEKPEITTNKPVKNLPIFVSTPHPSEQKYPEDIPAYLDSLFIEKNTKELIENENAIKALDKAAERIAEQVDAEITEELIEKLEETTEIDVAEDIVEENEVSDEELENLEDSPDGYNGYKILTEKKTLIGTVNKLQVNEDDSFILDFEYNNKRIKFNEGKKKKLILDSEEDEIFVEISINQVAINNDNCIITGTLLSND
jgi:hypothetical protein